jgi:hypothetical protein
MITSRYVHRPSTGSSHPILPVPYEKSHPLRSHGFWFFLCVDGILHISTKKNRKNTLFALFSHLILYLVGGFNPSEKYEFVSWDYDIPI